MSVDYTKLQLTSSASSNKLWQQGNGTFTVASLPGAGEVFGIATISHGFTSDNLLFQVSATTDLVGTTDYTTLPWQSNDGRVFIYAYIDSTNLYVVRINTDSSGFGFPASTVTFSYRLLVP